MPPRGGWGGSLEASLGADEQEPDSRLVRWGNPAEDAEAQQPIRHRTSKSGGVRGKEQCLTLGDLRVSPDHRSRTAATPYDGRGEVSRGHSNPDDRVKGRIRQLGAAWTNRWA